MKTRSYINNLGIIAKISVAVLVVSIILSSCMLEGDPSIVTITDQDVKFLKKCLGEDGTIHIDMHDRLREQLKEIVKDDGPRTLVSFYKHPFPPTIPEDRVELKHQCYHFIWDGGYNADDDFF